MTQAAIEKAFKEAIENKELKMLELTKFQRYDLKNKPCSTARKLEILWLLGKFKLSETTR